MENTLHVGLLYGGRSPEHEVSIDSAGNVLRAFAERYRVTPIYIDRDGGWHVETPETARLNGADAPAGGATTLLSTTAEGAALLADHGGGPEPLDLDVVFPILHGPNGEDGRVQGLLQTLGLPYVGADVLGSASCMDKEVTKRLLRDAGLPVVPFRIIRFGSEKASFDEIADALETNALFVKPANGGSSVGAAKTTDQASLDEAVKTAFEYDNKVLVETTVSAREIECAVAGNEDPEATVPGEVVSEADFYTYDAKYDEEANQAHMEVPADLPDETAERIRTLAVDAYRILGCEGMARVDFFLTDGGDLFLNEINTIPGFTKRSMYPVMWEHMGISQTDLLDRLIQLALDRHERDARLKVAR